MWAALVLAAQIVAAVQVHGNTATKDDEVRHLAGIEVGAPVEANTVEEITARLRRSKRFESVQVLKRFASIEDPSQILLVIVVDEGPVRIERTDDPANPTRVVRSHPLNLMFMPVLAHEDGYGFIYGARIARPDVAGRNSRLSFPLTWGGEKKAGAEIEKSIEHAPIDRVTAGVSLSRRTNPFYERDDDRSRVWVRAEREVVRAVRVGATAGWQHVSFMNDTDQFAHAGADVVLDTRVDPNLPRNGPGRSKNGNFVLQEFMVVAAPLEKPAVPCKPTLAEKTVAIGLVSAISVSFLNESFVWVRFQSATTIAVRSRQSLILVPPWRVKPAP
jgi:hypothetical protein